MENESIIEFVWLCELTGQKPVAGACPTHGGDNCIAMYVHYATRERDLNNLGGNI